MLSIIRPLLLLMTLIVPAASLAAETKAPENEAIKPGIRSSQRLTLISANDGHSHLKLNAEAYTSNVPLRFERTNVTRDSISVVTLGPDHPPIVKTIYGTVPNTVWGSPYLATTPDGHFAFVTCHTTGSLGPKPGNLISMIDLSLPDFDVVAKVQIETPTMAAMHPNGKQLVVGCSTGFKVFEVSAGGLVLKKDNKLDSVPESFDISPKGDRIVAAHHKSAKTPDSGVRVYSFEEGTISLQHEVSARDTRWKFEDPFSLRFSPDGKRVLAPNGAGLSSKGRLDDVFSIDMTLASPQVTEVIPQVADGMESLAFHPKGHIAVIACLDDCPGDAIAGFSHLAVVDLTSKPAQILYYMGTDSYPEGIEFSPDGSQLFVQQTAANQISIYNVDGFTLKPSPFVLRVGHGPSSMGIAKAFRR